MQSQNESSDRAEEECTSKVAKMRKYENNATPENEATTSSTMENTRGPSVNMDNSHKLPSPWVNQYAIVKSIFQLLPLKDLLAASTVCRFWSEVGQYVRGTRKNEARTLLWHPYSEQGRTKEAVEYYNDVNISPETNQFMDNAHPSFIDVLDMSLSDEVFSEWSTCFWRDFTQQFPEHQMVVFFATKSFAQYIQTRKKRLSSKKKKITEQEALFGQSIPQVIPCVCAFGTGVAFSLPTCPTTVYEMERTELPMMTGLLIPKVPGLRVRVITFEKELAQIYNRRRSVTSENCMGILGISPEDDVKGILFLDADSQGRYTNPFLDAAFQYIKEHPKVSFAGGNVFFTATSVSDEEMNKQLGFGVLICGDGDGEDSSGNQVKVGSVGLFQRGITQENEAKLKKFQSLLSAGESSLAFMFACNGRGAYMHHKEHAEVELFRKLYPTTPLIGIFTNGELVHEYLPGESPDPPNKRSDLEFTFSTIFLFVSYAHN